MAPIDSHLPWRSFQYFSQASTVEPSRTGRRTLSLLSFVGSPTDSILLSVYILLAFYMSRGQP